ncbi:S1C family serine protease [Natronococcus occultus]|uniref:Trypsin-like serine protease with C-terminal PDZ domain n=1 Tax=Natronococcus occultus SP4 TaxID=694430 RepID=L0JUF7_9EURY|nr:trypsin-like peptidase domain-containing protein [Natronococcus occultus]AGB36662.1 trypsin-like serine protease with C-terminal PDZ domain [Natronococcus occultus SP4]
MDQYRPSRRGVLAAAGAGIAGLVAGCAEPRTESSIEGGSAHEIDRENRADGSTYTDVYEGLIDSVTQIRVLGIENPYTEEEGQGQGSGFVVDDDYIVTNEHVVAGGTEIDLQYINGDWSGTRLLGSDRISDLAVLEADHVPEDATPLGLSETRPVVGQEVLAIGNPYGLEGSMSAGIVSGVDRTVPAPHGEFTFPNVVQTDAAVNPGNSGGPLVDLDGNVVGVVNAGGGDNIGFAISAALSRRVVPALIEDGEYEHPFLGIALATVDRFVAEENDLEEAAGVIVTETIQEPALGALEAADGTVERGGEPVPVGGDVIRSIDEEPIPDRHALSTYLALETSPGETVSVELLRDGEPRTVDLTLGSRPQPN